MSNKQPPFRVFAVTGGCDRRQGGTLKADFPTFRQARDYRDTINDFGNIHIKLPNGSWWSQDYKV